VETTARFAVPLRLGADRLLAIAAVLSIGILLQLIVAHSVWMLLSLLPLLLAGHLWHRQARSAEEGAMRLQNAVTALIAGQEPTIRSARRAGGQLHVVPDHAG
jgi:hypothetical protein